jgi:hypothetical protein
MISKTTKRVLQSSIISFISIGGGTGKTTNAIYTAALLQQLGLSACIVDQCPYETGARAWSEWCVDELPFPVHASHQLTQALESGRIVVLDAPNHLEKMINAIALSDYIVICVRPTEIKRLSKNRTLKEFKVYLRKKQWGILVHMLPDKQHCNDQSVRTTMSLSDLRDQALSSLFDLEIIEAIDDLKRQGVPILGRIPGRYEHAHSYGSLPLLLQDHYRALKHFLKLPDEPLSLPPDNYRERLETHTQKMFEMITVTVRDQPRRNA